MMAFGILRAILNESGSSTPIVRKKRNQIVFASHPRRTKTNADLVCSFGLGLQALREQHTTHKAPTNMPNHTVLYRRCQLEQHGLLAVQAVFGLGEYQGAFVVQEGTFDLIAVVGGQAVQDFQV